MCPLGEWERLVSHPAVSQFMCMFSKPHMMITHSVALQYLLYLNQWL